MTIKISKNPKANEFRAQADALRQKLIDPKETLTKEGAEQLYKDIQVLELRAQAAADFTPEAEIEEKNLTSQKGPEFEGRAEPAWRMQPEVDGLRKDIVAEYGSVAEYLKAASAANGANTKTLTRSNQLVKKLFTDAMSNEFLVPLPRHLSTRAVVGTAGDSTGGEFMLPLTQAPDIFRVANIQEGVFQRARVYNVPGRSIRIPMLVQTSASLARPMAGIAAVQIIGEGSTKDVRNPTFEQKLLTVYKYAAITQVGDELLNDDFTGELPQSFIDSVGQEAVNQVNFDVTINGTGVSQPLGALHANNTALLTVSRSNGAGTIGITDMFNMYQSGTIGPNSFWVTSRSGFAKLAQLTLTGTTLVTYLPNLNNNPRGATLLGMPIVVSDFMNPVGQLGDIGLVNGDFYAVALRQALTVQSSIHFAFADDVTTYRFIVRAGGIPLPDGAYAYRASGGQLISPHSPFVTLAA